MNEQQFPNEGDPECQEGNSQVYVLSDEEIHHLLNNLKVNQGNNLLNQNRHWPLNSNRQRSKPDDLSEEIALRLASDLPKREAAKLSNDPNDSEMMLFPDVDSMEKYMRNLSAGSGHFSQSKLWERSIIGVEGKAEQLLTDILKEIRMLRNELQK